MDTMQFRDYIFPHNPAAIQVDQGTRTASFFCPGRGDVVQRLGNRARRVRCSGSFFGDSFSQAMAELNRFQQRAGDGQAGMLFLPGMDPFLAYLREFAYEAQGDGRILPYVMEFVEAGGEG